MQIYVVPDFCDWVDRSICCNMLSSMAPVHKCTKIEVARISKKFAHRLAIFGAW